MATVAERKESLQNPTGEDRGESFVASALFLLAAVFVGIQILAGEVIPPLALPVIVYALLGVALWRWGGRRILITTLVLTIVHILSSIPFFASNFAHPESPASFLSDGFGLIVTFTVIAGAVLALRGSGARARRVVSGCAASLAVLALLVSLIAAGGVVTEPLSEGDVVVEAEKARYTERLEVPAGGASLWVDNRDRFRHTLVVEGTDVHEEVPGSASVRFEVDLAPGTYRYFCDVPGHDGMEGELVVSG